MLLKTERLTKHYGACRALDGLDLEVKPSEIVGLLGPNGSGKSTALRLVVGFLQPTAGRAMVAGHDCWADGVAARRQLAYLPGELRLYENMTGRQLVRFLERLRGQRKPPGEVTLARQFDIDLDRPIAQLSSGMKRKVALLQVLISGAPLLLMDEPTNALDPAMRDELLTQLRAARDRGAAVLFSSHVLAEVERVCDRVAILQGGRLVYCEPVGAAGRVTSVDVKFQGAAPPAPALAGLRSAAGENGRLTFELSGPVGPLLEWLAGQRVAELRIEPLGLAAVYRRFHGSEA